MKKEHWSFKILGEFSIIISAILFGGFFSKLNGGPFAFLIPAVMFLVAGVFFRHIK